MFWNGLIKSKSVIIQLNQNPSQYTTTQPHIIYKWGEKWEIKIKNKIKR